MTVNGVESVFSADVRGNEYRQEDLDRQVVSIQNLAKRVSFSLDLKRHEYSQTSQGLGSLLFSFGMWTARPPQIQESGKRVDIYYEVVDTGEKRQMLGQTARHLILRQRVTAEPGAC